jgi:hypothetical protein
MTEYDVKKMYAEQQERERITSLHANGGIIEIRYADGTSTQFKRSRWRKKFKQIKSRG